jgi:hypothetical protein
MGHGQGERSVAAGTEAEHVDGWNIQVPQHGCEVVGGIFGGEGAINWLSASVSLLFYGDDLSGLGEQRDEFVEIGLDRGPPPWMSIRGARPGWGSP